MPWSEAQVKAITTYDKNLLVAAAAGSGKTAVLVERIIQRLLGGQCDIDEILVLTFTNAAAAEMRERIALAIHEALAENPESQHLQRQLVLLNAAAISTMHAFCQTLIRQNFHQLDLDPKFRLSSEPEMDLLKRDVLENLFEEKYESAAEDFLNFVDAYGNERSDDALYDIVLKLYSYSRSQPFSNDWLCALPAGFALPADISLEQTPWLAPVKKEIALAFAACLAICDDMLRTAAELGCEFCAPIAAADREVVLNLQSQLDASWTELRAAVYAVKFATMRFPKGTEDEIKAIFSGKRQKLKDRIKAVKEAYFMMEEADLLADLRSQVPLLTTICQLTVDFAAAFRKAKRDRAIVDFNDLEHFALEVLLADEAASGHVVPSETARKLQQKYREVMVDEYQDTNGVQEAILSLVCKADAPNLFLVGDVKQSIYRFRLAEPELFLQKYHVYPEAGADYARIDLAQNFRSRPEILAAINYIFAQLMSEDIAELPYGAAEELNPGPDYPPAQGKTLAGPVELDIIDREQTASEVADEGADDGEGEELTGFALEARYIAERIQKLMQEGYQVFDKADKAYRPLAWRDIVVLLRSVKGKADVLLETLRAADIPTYAAVDAGYFQETEIQTMLALLQSIDNPRQDIPLAAVLYSPLVELTAAELAQIRLSADGDLFAALLAATAPETGLPTELKDRIMGFLQQLSRWRNLARRASVPELVWQLFRDTGYYDYVGGTPGGLLRQANLRMLYDRAGEYEATNFRGLFRFLRFIEKMQNMGTDLAAARTLGESENVVRIMSIHKSKGLEFPVVLVADLGKNFNLLDSREVLLLHKKYGLGPYKIDEELSVRYPTFARQAIACQIDRENKAEELRVLYVALTRAREKLILIGSTKKLAAKALEWCRQIAVTDVLLPDYMIADAKSYLDWLGAVVARHADGKALRECAQTAQPQYNIRYADTSHWQVNILPAWAVKAADEKAASQANLLQLVAEQQQMPATENETWVKARLDWSYPAAGARQVAAKLSVTEAKRRFAAEADPAATLLTAQALSKRPKFIQHDQGLTGNEYGTLLHSIMQHVNLQGDLSPAGLKKQLDAFVEREIILPQEAAMVKLTSISRFFASTLGKRLRQASKVRREMAFSRMLQAKRFYPEVQDEHETIFMQGIVDVLFEEADGLVLVDYKTDSMVDHEEIIGKYKLQIDLYSEAAAAILKKNVKERYLYLFHNGEIIAI